MEEEVSYASVTFRSNSVSTRGESCTLFFLMKQPERSQSWWKVTKYICSGT